MRSRAVAEPGGAEVLCGDHEGGHRGQREAQRPAPDRPAPTIAAGAVVAAASDGTEDLAGFRSIRGGFAAGLGGRLRLWRPIPDDQGRQALAVAGRVTDRLEEGPGESDEAARPGRRGSPGPAILPVIVRGIGSRSDRRSTACWRLGPRKDDAERDRRTGRRPRPQPGEGSCRRPPAGTSARAGRGSSHDGRDRLRDAPTNRGTRPGRGVRGSGIVGGRLAREGRAIGGEVGQAEPIIALAIDVPILPGGGRQAPGSGDEQGSG